MAFLSLRSGLVERILRVALGETGVRFGESAVRLLSLVPAASPLSSMFHRRLILIMGGTVLATGALVAQLTRLTVVQGAEHRRDAEAKLVTKEWTPPGGAGRGRILDRK